MHRVKSISISSHWTNVYAAISIIWYFNPSSHNKAIRRQWMGPSLIQVMDCCLFVARLLAKPMSHFLSIPPLGNELGWHLNQNVQVFFLENMFEIAVCKTVAILLRPRVCERGCKMVCKSAWMFTPHKISFVNLYLLIWHMTDSLHCIDSIVSYETISLIKQCMLWTIKNLPFGAFERFLIVTTIVSQIRPKLLYVQ